jgi:hypothetical protein
MSLPILEQLWMDSNMDFILGLPRTQHGNNSIMVDQFSKISHFIPCHKTDDTVNIVDLFFIKVVCLHRVLKNIISNCDAKFLSYF